MVRRKYRQGTLGFTDKMEQAAMPLPQLKYAAVFCVRISFESNMDEKTVPLHGHFLRTKLCMYVNSEGTGAWVSLEKMKWRKGSPWDACQAFSLPWDPNDILSKRKRSFQTELKRKTESI